MNAIQKINKINQKELESNVSDSASWHADYKDTSYIYIGFLQFELNEMDIVKMFSQYGIPTHINLIKDRETGKSRGFCYLKYEDYKSCVLAIDNLNGIQVLDKKIKVDHVYYYLKDDQDENDFIIDYSEAERELKEIEDDTKDKNTKLIKGKSEHKQSLLDGASQGRENGEFDDPMAAYISKMKEDNEDFVDPMAEYIGSKNEKHKSRHNRHKHRHRSEHDRDDDSKHKRSRDRSPSRRSHREKSPSEHKHRDRSLEVETMIH